MKDVRDRDDDRERERDVATNGDERKSKHSASRNAISSYDKSR